MAVVSETLELPGGGAPSNVTVTVTLAGESGRPLPAAYDLAGNTIVGSHQVVPVAGVWSVTLDRNDEIIPAGTAWKIVLSGPGVSAKPRFVSVVGAGPFDVEDILTDAPASIDPSTYALLDTRVDALEATTQPLDADLTTIAALDSATAGAMATDGAGWVRKTYAQLKTALGLVKADVGLGNVDNTADSAKPVSTAQQTALDLKAPIPSSIRLGPPDFAAVQGSPVVNGASFNALWTRLEFDAAATERVAGVVDIPSGWLTFAIDVVWTCTVAGNVRWSAQIRAFGANDGDGIWVSGDASSQGGSATAASPNNVNGDATVRTTVATGLSTANFLPNDLIVLNLGRVGGDAADTAAGDAYALGVLLRRLT